MSNAGEHGEAGQAWHGIPDDAIILGEIRIVNYLNPEGSARFGYAMHGLLGDDGDQGEILVYLMTVRTPEGEEARDGVDR